MNAWKPAREWALHVSRELSHAFPERFREYEFIEALGSAVVSSAAGMASFEEVALIPALQERAITVQRMVDLPPLTEAHVTHLDLDAMLLRQTRAKFRVNADFEGCEIQAVTVFVSDRGAEASHQFTRSDETWIYEGRPSEHLGPILYRAEVTFANARPPLRLPENESTERIVVVDLPFRTLQFEMLANLTDDPADAQVELEYMNDAIGYRFNERVELSAERPHATLRVPAMRHDAGAMRYTAIVEYRDGASRRIADAALAENVVLIDAVRWRLSRSVRLCGPA